MLYVTSELETFLNTMARATGSTNQSHSTSECYWLKFPIAPLATNLTARY